MRPECIKAVTQAIGRSLTQPEIKGIEDRVRRNMRQLAQTDPTWQSKSSADRLNEAAAKSAKDLVAEADLKKKRIALTILAHDRVDSYMKRFPDRPLEGLDRLMAFSADGKSGIQSIESASRAIRDDSLSRMLDVIDQTKGKFLGLFQNEAGNLALVRELHGEDSGSATAKAAAKSFKDTAEQLRQRFNRAGGDVGFLDDWNMPRDHSQIKVAKSQAKWVDDHVQWANRAKYMKEDGSPMNDAELTDFLNHAWVTLATGGVNKLEPGRAAGNGMRANRGSESRQIHYKDAESFIAAQKAYGDRNLLELLIGHVDRASRDIALVETLGPNPSNQMRYFLDEGQQASVTANPNQADKVAKQRRKIEHLYEEVAGTREPPASAALANGFDTYRALNVASRLGSAVLTSVTDQGTLGITASMNGMPVMQVFANEIRMMNPASAADRRLAQRAGLGLNQLIGSLNRWGADGLGSTEQVSGRISKFAQTAAGKVMQASGLNALTAGTQRAFGAVMMDTIGDMSRRHQTLAAMDPADSKRLLGQGVTETDWAVWRLAQPEDWRGAGDTVLTANSIYRIADADLVPLAKQLKTTPQRLKDQAATKLLGTVLDETNMAIIEPGAREKAAMHGGVERGTVKGELVRSFWQFKSFSVGMLMRHGQRAMSQEGWGKAGYIASLVATTTVLGGMAIQLNEIASGRDPKDITSDKKFGVPGLQFGIAAFLKGGAMGLYGDFLFSDTSQGGSSPLAALGGPIAGDIESIFKLKDNAADGEVNQTGAKLVRLAKSHLPAANLWYTKAALDHMIFNQLQEHFSPGYLRRMKQRAKKEFGQSFWWDPKDTTPGRAPNIGAAVGVRP
ncbi:hypothetical protein [Pseudomonas gingeri]|uniref:hypothetical protein n=1 Tax=Pseudomonas gingeri TaxID=117681 RepID=UPI0015A2ED8C|nr:hypothetical protein [Pseudomonas gingeri]NWA03716.1 hypothetical protein [Pseudomonas gingeri]NWA14575.1 hypothetical protein [Pseudomonas gingeri]NWA54807.1 hypothetical protein [Pseudomonas gingeri]NWA94531.1 hypothetical protein [Pseudomonas gingeri]NWB01187.1 hypothetical protein [Pseudomonas gingeri]